RERPLHGNLLVEEHADEQRQRIAAEQVVGLGLLGDLDAHGTSFARPGGAGRRPRGNSWKETPRNRSRKRSRQGSRREHVSGGPRPRGETHGRVAPPAARPPGRVFEWSGRPDPRRPRAAGPGARPDERYTGHGGADR